MCVIYMHAFHVCGRVCMCVCDGMLLYVMSCEKKLNKLNKERNHIIHFSQNKATESVFVHIQKVKSKGQVYYTDDETLSFFLSYKIVFFFLL